MSNQLQITGGAKVRNLEGVLTGTSGVVSSLGINVPSGIPQLDGSGKILVSQLPNSVMEYKGTWNAATNTPTLADGTGNQGDVYLCNVAGTTNFGSGPITFAVGDQVIYSGTIWQKASGATGTVTSVAVTSTGNDAISITGSPITTAGTINIGFTGDNTQYINGAGDLTTFPSLTGYVPYTGATTDVDLGVHVLNAQALHVKGTAGAGHLGLKHQSAAATGSANESLIYANVDGDLAWQNDNLYLTTLSTHANTANRVYTFPNASGTIALTSDISYPVTSVFGRTGAVTAQSGDYTTTQVTEGTNLYYTDARARGAISLTTTGTSGAATYNSTTGVLNVPNYGSALSGYVPYTGATSAVDLGNNNLSSFNVNVNGDNSTYGGILNFRQANTVSGPGSLGYTSINALGKTSLWFYYNISSGVSKAFNLSSYNLTNNVPRTYTMPDADGTIALTSDIPSLANYVTTNTNQSITGIKTFTNEQLFGNGMTLTGGYITYTSGSYNLTLNTNILTANRNVFLQDKAGTIALTSDLTGGTVTSVGLSSATSGVTIGSSPITTSGTITLAIATASGSQQGLLSSTDWTTFNNKQNALTNPVTGTGTTNYHAKFTASSTIGNSLIWDNGTNVGIGNTNTSYTLDVSGTGRYVGALTLATTGYVGTLQFATIAPATLAYDSGAGQMSFNITAGGVGTTPYYIFKADSSSIVTMLKNGNIGFGTSSPNLSGGASGSTILTISATSSGRNGLLELNGTRVNSGDVSSYIRFFNNSAATPLADIRAIRGSSDTAGDLAITTSDTERMRVASDGTINMNATSGNKLVTVKGQTGNGYYGEVRLGNVDHSAGIIGRHVSSGQANLEFWTEYYSSGGYQKRMTIEYNGYISMPAIYNGFTTSSAANMYMYTDGGIYRSTSSLKYKQNVQDYTKGLAEVMQLRPVSYEGKSEVDAGKTYAGLIAEEVHDLGLTEFVQYTEDGSPDALAYQNMIALLTKAIQELSTKVTELENKLN